MRVYYLYIHKVPQDHLYIFLSSLFIICVVVESKMSFYNLPNKVLVFFLAILLRDIDNGHGWGDYFEVYRLSINKDLYQKLDNTFIDI